MSKTIARLDVAEILIEIGQGKLSPSDLGAVRTLLPDWEFSAHFTLGRGESTGKSIAEANRQLKFGKAKNDLWLIAREGLLDPGSEITSGIKEIFNENGTEVDVEAKNVTSMCNKDEEVCSLSIEKTTPETNETQQITHGFLGRVIKTDLLLTEYGLIVTKNVDFQSVAQLLQEPSARS